jgi:adenylate cyclase
MPQDIIPSRPSSIAVPRAADPVTSRTTELQRWAVGEGLRGAVAYDLFAGFCERLVKEGIPLCRGYAALETMHPQWWGFGFTWQRGLNYIKLAQFGHEHATAPSWVGGVFHHLAGRAKAGECNPSIRRRIGNGAHERDFPALERFHAAGATDYLAELFSYPAAGDPVRGLGVVYSFLTDRPSGFVEDDTTVLRAALPALSLAMKADAGHVSASGLLQVYLGEDAGRRVQGGGIARGAVESLRAVVWYADIRGFTALADSMPGAALVHLLDDVFETLTAALRRHGGQVLKFIGDGMLAAFAFEETKRRDTSRRALEAAADAMLAIDALSAEREAAGRPAVVVDLALHLGEVLYGNVGAVDRLDFTMVGPTVNVVSRIEALCERLGHRVLVSDELARAAELDDGRLVPIGRHGLRGVRQDREIYAFSIRRQS